MNLPDFPSLTAEMLRALLDKHGLMGYPVRRLPDAGLFNAVFQVGDEFVLRVPRNHPAFIAAARKEALAVPTARAAGVLTPELVSFDDTLELLAVPYSLYERVVGENLGLLELDPSAVPEVYRELGRNLARLHAGVTRHGAIAELKPEDLGTPEGLPEVLAEEGFLSGLEARWLTSWLERLRPYLDEPVTAAFLHGDVQMSNVMLGPDLRYLALLDWGGAGWGDPAHDFAGVPLRGVPFMLEGYQEVKAVNEALAGRILHRQLHLALFLLRRKPQPRRSWAERPQSMMLEVLRFFAERPQGIWAKLY